ncbi:MAG: DNA repair protein RecO C-terminal domain-containing protein [Muribaculaceae bacterium]|nr:DNA repair protein RecO C-terminal domain-containing protein [Muribaculaceae bacterium]
MYDTIHCLCLRLVRHDDASSILTAWSAERGRVAVSIPAGAGREAQRRRALAAPLALVEGVVVSRPGREVLRLRDMRPWAVTSSVRSHPVKAAVALFLADVLEGVLRTTVADEQLSRFLFDAVQLLEGLTRPAAVANFHLWFLRALATFTGIAPDFGSWRPGRVFDMAEAVFRATPPLHGRYLDPEQAAAVHILGRLTPANMGRLRLNRDTRRRLLEGILEYYALHGALPAGASRSLAVLRTLF